MRSGGFCPARSKRDAGWPRRDGASNPTCHLRPASERSRRFIAISPADHSRTLADPGSCNGLDVRATLKRLAFGLALIAVLPAWLSFQIRRILLGGDRALHGSSQMLSLVPGVTGQYLRRAFFWLVLDECSPSVTVEFGTVLSRVHARMEANVYVGPHCHLGNVHLERDVLLAAGVHVPSGPNTHGIADRTRPI